MANLERELSSLVNDQPEPLKGTLGLNSSTIKVSNRPGYVWVRMLDNPSEIIKAYNNVVSPTYNLPVVLSYNGRRYEVVKIDIDRYENWPTSYVPYHGKQHSAARGSEGQDIVWVDSQQFLPLLVVPDTRTGTNSVNVWSSYYQDSNGNWSMVGGTGISNYTSMDVTGSTLYLVMLDDNTKQLYNITGSILSPTITGTQDVLANTPAIPPAHAMDSPLALIKVRPNHRISWRDIYNLRKFIHPNTAAGSQITFFDVSDQVDGITQHFVLDAICSSVKLEIGGIAQHPNYAVLDDDKLGFTIPEVLPVGTQVIVLANLSSGSVLVNKNYDSGWFPINCGQKITKTHNLGTQSLIISIYLDNDSNGASGQLYPSYTEPGTFYGASVLINNDDNSFDVVMGVNGYVKRNAVGTYSGVITTNIYCRVVAIGIA